MNGEYIRRIKRLLDRVGISLRFSKNSRPIDFTYINDPNPLELAYRYGARSALLNVPLARCRHMKFLAFPCEEKSLSPFIQFLTCFLIKKMHIKNTDLYGFYDCFQPANAEELIGIGSIENKSFAKSPPAAAILPWLLEGPEEQIKLEDRFMLDDSLPYGKSMGLDSGHMFFGPTSLEKVKLEVFRLITVFKSIKENGYKADSSGYMNINVTCLFSSKENDWRFLVQGGEHRMAALSALGYETVTVQITRHGLTGIVQREHANHWPAVRKGYFTEEEAVKIFDRIFDGEQPLSYTKAMGDKNKMMVDI